MPSVKYRGCAVTGCREQAVFGDSGLYEIRSGEAGTIFMNAWDRVGMQIFSKKREDRIEGLRLLRAKSELGHAECLPGSVFHRLRVL